MKKMWMAVVLLLAMLVPLAQAEQAPEERVTEIAARTAYILDYDWERLPIGAPGNIWKRRERWRRYIVSPLRPMR